MRVSVVIPTFRRPDLLRQCLAALRAQLLDVREFEVLVCDDAASDETRRQVETFAAESPMCVRYVAVLGNHGPAAARNAGWRIASADIIAFTDDDCRPHPRWLSAASQVFDMRPEITAVVGRTIVPLPPAPTDYEQDTAGLENAEFVTANCFCRRDFLDRIGGFDERYTTAWREDSDLHFALLAHGEKLAVASEAIVTHPVRSAPWGVCLKLQRKCLFDALLYKKYPSLYRQRIRPGTPWDYYAAVTAILLAGVALALGYAWLAMGGALVWLVLTTRFLARRLRRTSWAPAHLAEMAVTSPLIPFLSVYWRLYGACKFRVFFL